MKTFLVLNGPAGSGKGTLAMNLEKHGYQIVGAGEELRKYIASAPKNDPLRIRIENRVNQGKNADTKDLYSIIASKIASIEGKVLGDGIIRTHDQAQWLVNFTKINDQLVHFINLVCPFDILMERLTNRFFVPNSPHPYPSYGAAYLDCKNGEIPIVRKDDNPELIKNRFAQYQENINLILEELDRTDKIKVHSIDTNNTPEKIQESVLSSIQ